MNDITPKEAIANLNHIYGMVAPDIQRSLDVAIKALERPKDDLISREALKEQVKNEVCEVCFTSPDERQCSPNCKLCTFKELIDNAPPVDAIVNTIEVRPKGEWVDKGNGRYECSVCGHFPAKQSGFPWLSSFCPECGADMRTKENLNG